MWIGCYFNMRSFIRKNCCYDARKSDWNCHWSNLCTLLAFTLHELFLLSFTYSRTSRNWAWGCWYVSNVSIIYEVFMLLYYHSWMFYNHFIATLYHFLGLTYWPTAQCQLLFFACFLHRRKSISNGVQTPRNFLEIFYWPEGTQWAWAAPRGCPEGGTTHQGTPGLPGAPR